MVETRLVTTDEKDEFQQIIELIRKEENFLLSGGAGSGKTYSLVQVIRKVIAEYPTTKVACMTYTNAAVKQIEERVNHDNLKVTTIHDFLWENIKNYQSELKKVLIELINDGNIDKIKLINDAKVESNFYDEIENINYSYQRAQLVQGIISHDELLIVSNRMFKNHKLLCDIIKDKFKFIFIDEYQDSNKVVIEIFLEHLSKSEKKNIIGFFGDSMQSIYDEGIGNLDSYLKNGLVKEVKKIQNRRNPKLVIELANRLRTDGIQQEPSKDLKAPNMEKTGNVKEGNIMFIYSKNEDVQKVKDYLENKWNWNFLDTRETKELNLTHNLVAKKEKHGFKELMDIYNNDKILDYKKAILDELRKKEDIELLEDDTFGDVIKKVNLPMSNPIQTFINENQSLYNEAKTYKFSLFKKIYLNSDILTDDKKQTEEEENKRGSKRDHLLKHLFKIQNNIHYYKKGLFNDFIKEADYLNYLKGKGLVFTIEQKKILKKNIDELINTDNKTIGEVINEADEKGICLKSYNLLKYEAEKQYAYNRITRVKFSEFQNVYNYLEGLTPFSTQHKVKGDEFDNVLVVLDNGRWPKYNFKYLFENNGNPSVLERTKKIFYVCCTRSKENLAVFYHNPSNEIITKAKEWFGNVIDLENI